MKFEVKNRQGKTIFHTESEECIPDKQEQDTLREAGYRIFADGKELKR